MPAVKASPQPTPSYPAFAASSVAPRQKLKTPLIAGSVCGGVMGIVWIMGFTIYFRKRYKRKQRKRKIGDGNAMQDQKRSKLPEENVVVPPDPAILLGHRLPGEQAFKDDNDSHQEANGGDYRQHANGTELSSPAHTLSNGALSAVKTLEEKTTSPKK
ncbi:hypothetical protein D9615_004621 [Tricholomella constricta]|uniref:Uncharacterized protein n=1 Tax=Tricholomella constricta TaxID=117010 RepID=A0A8H5M4E2_9AGAR|nr:hypothetical protein D9615_004621 [Tricholomella constricta]